MGFFQEFALNALLFPKVGPQLTEASAFTRLDAHLQPTSRNIYEWPFLFHAFVSFNRLCRMCPVHLAQLLGRRNR